MCFLGKKHFMKSINILSLVQAYESLQEKNYKSFLAYYDISISNEEVEDLALLTKSLSEQVGSIYVFNQFYVGYLIPQIGKEFDLLRLGEDCIVNIELKRTSSKDKIEKQLIRNKYYLSFTGKIIHNFCFQADTQEIFYLNDVDELEVSNFVRLIEIVEAQKLDNKTNIDDLFDPSNYLVSPFNSTEKFLSGEYFLTKQQESIKSKIIESFQDENESKFVSITGSAGTGKTLLTYDIAKELKENGKKYLIIHCGLLNDGQIKLNDKYDWEIIPIKVYSRYNLSEYDVVIVDEAQRIYPEQLTEIVETILSANGKCIFSYDKLQTLATWEERRNIDNLINNINSITTHNLTEKIRTNKDIALFMKALFNGRRSVKLSGKEKIELNYFQSTDDAKEYLETLDNQQWEILRFTPSQYNKEHHKNYSDPSHKTSHGIIGQEFENVVITIDKFFCYDDDGKLQYKGNSYYDAAKMLFQNITRTRKRLNIVIIENSELLDRCVSILGG